MAVAPVVLDQKTLMATSVSQEAPGSTSERGVRVEAISQETYAGACKVMNDFIGAGKGLCFGCCPFRWCPQTLETYSEHYEKHPDCRLTTAVAVREEDGFVLGVCRMSVYGQPRRGDDLHALSPGEAYFEQIAVSAEARGKGIGMRFLQWGEQAARARGMARLTLSVVAKNPAKRLYEKFGFVDQREDCLDHFCSSFLAACFVGMPNGAFGLFDMEKRLT